MWGWNHRHELEYRYERTAGQREHVYTERVNDQGFCFEHRPERRQDWLVTYTRCCADDYLGRVRARAGTWLVSVYRVVGAERTHLVSIRLRHPGGTRDAGGDTGADGTA
ncbi:hypothetical protein SAMN06265360_10956 [Haloechinothrix alba]|uniref:Uncharacterized protein n=1 Tax=Haloechinothrix alba TaxID=664784 RepID=A0A238X502_9PSEU|nr:hypothetical protein [Haloechinothrix alba]SNR53780.1 hypothetical protein SAMN06265360_10956 [Haloechinothrix alba]